MNPTARRDTIPAERFFALAQPGIRFRAWPASHHDLYAGLILTATTTAVQVDDDLCVSFTYPDWWHTRDGGIWQSATQEHHFELIPPGAPARDLCGCGQPGDLVPDPYLPAYRKTAKEAPRLLPLCPPCLADVESLFTNDRS